MAGAGSRTEIGDRLSHVYWIGGSPCSGKSSIAAWLADRVPLRTYTCDDPMWAHMARATPEAQPTMHRIANMSWEQIWMRPVDVLLADEIAFYREEWPMILEDLAALPSDRPIVAEGAALLPSLVHAVLADRRRAVWVVPSEAFQFAHYPQREALLDYALDGCAEPDQAFRNWMARDAAMGCWVRAEAQRLGLSVLVVDGARALEGNAASVARRLGIAVRRER
ncbi:MAG: hypothetical protein JXA09_15590 [Anaerolineae bacterium]|nr:hypothetical protein [Anaerolineae bacterium]